jgi:hypothetical protein
VGGSRGRKVISKLRPCGTDCISSLSLDSENGEGVCAAGPSGFEMAGSIVEEHYHSGPLPSGYSKDLTVRLAVPSVGTDLAPLTASLVVPCADQFVKPNPIVDGCVLPSLDILTASFA